MFFEPIVAEHKMYCRRCSYPLDGLRTSRCPECGRTFDLVDPSSYSKLPADQFRKVWNRRALIVIAILFVCEVFCALVAYSTLGEIDSWLLLCFVIAGNLFLLGCVLFRRPQAALVFAICVGLLVIPYQAWLGIRLVALRIEVGQIVAYMNDLKVKTGNWPDPSTYQYLFPSNKYYIDKFRVAAGEDGYKVVWHIGTRSTSHWYDSKTGWHYYPD